MTDSTAPQTATQAPTPRAVRHRLNKMEAWFEKNRYAFSLQRQADADRLLDLAVTPAHADALAEALKAWKAEGARVDAALTGLAEAQTAPLPPEVSNV